MSLAEAGCVAAIALMMWAPRLSLMRRRLLRSVGAFATVSYVARACYILVAQPPPDYGNRLAEPLLLGRNYEIGLAGIAPLVLLGLASLLLILYLMNRLAPQDRWRLLEWSKFTIGSLVPLYMLSWAARLYLILAPSIDSTLSRTIIQRLALVAGALLGFLIVKTDWRGARTGSTFVLIGAIGEVGWAFGSTSKSPLVAVMLFLYLDPQRKRLAARQVVGTTLGIVLAFSAVQGAKVAGASAAATQGRATESQNLALSVLSRFDTMHALIVAHSAGPESFVTPDKAATMAATILIPQQLLGITRPSVGELWALRMEGVQNVSLADGSSGEGYAILGILGVILWNAATGVVIIALAHMLAASRSLTLGLFATLVVGSTALFEQGILEQLDTISTALQAAALAWLLIKIFGSGWRLRQRNPVCVVDTTARYSLLTRSGSEMSNR